VRPDADNSTGRMSLAPQGDDADVRPRADKDTTNGAAAAPGGLNAHSSPDSGTSPNEEIGTSRALTTTNCNSLAADAQASRSLQRSNASVNSTGSLVTLTRSDDIVVPATPFPIRAGDIVPRRRFQRGNIIIRGQTPQRYGMFREDVLQSDGTFKRVRRTVLLGPVSSLSERAAWQKFRPYLDRANEAAKIPRRSGITLGAFVKEYLATVAVNLKSSTRRAGESHLRAHILPKLGNLTLTEINTKIVQGFVAYLATGGRSRKTVENVLLTLSSILRKAKAWDYACGSFSISDITMPREGVRKEQRSFTDAEVGKILSAAPEPFATIFVMAAILGLRIGEALALRVSDVDFEQRIIRVRQSVDAATRTIQAVKSSASSADVPMPPQLEKRLRKHLQTHNGSTELLFVNQHGRPLSANKLRERILHPLLKKLGIPRGGFHSLRHGAASALLADGATPAVVQKQLRHSDPRITLGVYGHVIGNQQRDAVENRSARIEAFAVN
jgi:integrase